MVKLLAWFILSYGLMNIMVYGSIFQGLRDDLRKWGERSKIGEFLYGIISCPLCFSFHGGWFLSLTIFSPTLTLFDTPIWISWFFDGILSSGAVWAINSIIEWFEQNRPTNNH